MSTIKLKGSSSGEAEVTVAAAAGTPTFTLPTTVGSANQLLKNSGTAGTLEYASNLTYDGSKLVIAGTNSTNYLYLKNTSASDGSGARWNSIRFQGTQSGGEVSDLVQLQANHDGTADDEKGAFQVLVNDGNDGDSLQERLRVQSDGNVKINDGNLVIGTAGHGIDFSANSHASGMTSETLSDYEEGTFTPTIGGWSGSGTGTYGGQHGKYTKIGNMVTIWISMSWTNLTGASGVLSIQNIPFSANGGGSWGSACPIFIENVNLESNTVSVIGHQWQTSSSSILLYGVRDDTSWYGVGIDTSGGINLTCTYPTTA
tara:strand:- start:25 stop:969 length:945 start_codon:yes stop_codon:yes gene_type:complete